jgi:hypothetical protein
MWKCLLEGVIFHYNLFEISFQVRDIHDDQTTEIVAPAPSQFRKIFPAKSSKMCRHGRTDSPRFRAKLSTMIKLSFLQEMDTWRIIMESQRRLYSSMCRPGRSHLCRDESLFGQLVVERVGNYAQRNKCKVPRCESTRFLVFVLLNHCGRRRTTTTLPVRPRHSRPMIRSGASAHHEGQSRPSTCHSHASWAIQNQKKSK